MKHFTEPPIGILLTMPKVFFEETGHTSETLCRDFEAALNEEEDTWNFCKKNLPTKDFLYVYLVWEGKIQYRANLVGLERNISKSFIDTPDGQTRHFPGKNWIVMSGPAIKAPMDIPMKGFQGHRYVAKELF